MYTILLMNIMCSRQIYHAMQLSDLQRSTNRGALQGSGPQEVCKKVDKDGQIHLCVVVVVVVVVVVAVAAAAEASAGDGHSRLNACHTKDLTGLRC